MALRSIRKSSKGSNRTKHSKRANKNSKRTKKHQRGGAIYSFDLNDKIGGQPANIPLNGTADGDCPGSETKDLGFVNYGLTRGGDRKIKKKRSSSNKKSKSKSKSKSYSNKKSKSNRKH
jgi:hypothetical protein